MAKINPQQIDSLNPLGQLLEKLPSRPSKKVVVFCLAVLSVCFGIFVAKDLTMPISGGGDLDIWEYNGYYLAKNLSFDGFLHLDLQNNQVFYPYGVNSVFQSWGLERDLYYATLYSLFGIGPWLQFYYCLSVLIAIVGAYLLLEGDYGWRRAALAAVVMTVLNFYALGKFPLHFGYSTVHWTLLSIIADLLIVRRVVVNQPVSLKLLSLRAALLSLSLGHDLGYIAGFALTSFTISFVYIGGLLLLRHLRSELSLKDSLFSTIDRFKREFFASPLSAIFLATSIIGAYIYLPIVLQIAKAAGQFDFGDIFSGAWWVSPLRLLVPFLPFTPWSKLKEVLKDSPEFFYDGSVGLALLLIAAMGLWNIRRRLPEFFPLLVLLTICIFYHPVYFSVIKIFPWFSFFRLGGRSTAIYPIIFCLLALELRPSTWRGWNFTIFLIVGLAISEFLTFRSFLDYQPYRFDSNFFTYMQRVKEQPGEAVLDWPFCAIGGNGVGSATCPYYTKNAHVYALRRFHNKKVMGEYFGRVHPDQLEPYIRAGWSFLFSPDMPPVKGAPPSANRQTRCFLSSEWEFFDKFYKLNDFAGINLYTELLPPGCAQQFHQRYGEPTTVTALPGVGRVEFLAKPVALRDQVDSKAGVDLGYTPASTKLVKDFSKLDLLKSQEIFGLKARGLGMIEESTQAGRFRRVIQQPLELSFGVSEPRQLKLQLKFLSPIGDRIAIVEINGQEVAKIDQISKNDVVERQIKFRALSGMNKLTIGFEDKPRSIFSYLSDTSRRLVNKLSSNSEKIDMSNKYWYNPQIQELSIVDDISKASPR